MVSLVLDEMGAKGAESFLAFNNEPPAVTLRAMSDREELLDQLRAAGHDAVAGQWTSSAVCVRGAGRPASLPGFVEGNFAIMDEASILVAEALDARESQTVVDLCAGPGGKTGVLAGRTSRVVAVEPVRQRAGLVAQTLKRLRLHAMVVQGDGLNPPIGQGVDAVLVDAPCSGLGVIRRRPEARWRLKPEAISQLPELQSRLLQSAWDLVRPGGRVVYAVCTVTAAETVDVIGRFQRANPTAEAITVHPDIPRPDWRRGPYLQLVGGLHGTDSMFVAAFERPS